MILSRVPRGKATLSENPEIGFRRYTESLAFTGLPHLYLTIGSPQVLPFLLFFE